MAQGQGRAPGEANAMSGMKIKGASGLTKQLEEQAFQAGVDYEVPADVTAAIDQLIEYNPTFDDDPAKRAQRFETEIGAPATRQFQEETQRMLMQSLAGGRRFGPVAQATMFDSNEDFSTNLASLRSQFFREDEDRAILAKESAFGRMAGGASMRMGESVLPMQLKAALAGQSRGVDSANDMTNLMNSYLQIAQQQAGAQQAAGSSPLFIYGGSS